VRFEVAEAAVAAREERAQTVDLVLALFELSG